MDEDGPRWPQVTQSHVNRSGQRGLESANVEAAGYDWSCELLVMQTGNDDYNSVCECVRVCVF